MKKRPVAQRRLPSWGWLFLAPATAGATLSPTINPLGRAISAETETGGGFISLADLQSIVTARGDLKTAAVLTGEASDGTSSTTIATELANDGDPSDRGLVVTGIVETTGGGSHLTLTLPVRDGAIFEGPGDLVSLPLDGLIYAIQGSGDLAEFTTTGVIEITPALTGDLPPPPAGWSHRSFRLATPVSAGPRGFLRAGISQSP